jgi:transglutaminase-like putative cysteine protease
VHYDDLRALRSFFERVDVSSVAEGLSRPTSSTPLTMDSVLGRLPADWEAPFSFVQGAISYVPYGGSVRGARGTLEAGSGNGIDQALLLTSLLEARGVSARLVRGRLEWADAARLTVGTSSPPAPQGDDPWPRWLEGAADHWWVQARREDVWIDASVELGRGCQPKRVNPRGQRTYRWPSISTAR